MITEPGEQNNEAPPSPGEKSAASRFKPMKRWLLVFMVFVILALALIKACLPAIVERIIYDQVEAAGFHDVELRVQRVSLSSSSLRLVSVTEQDWCVSASRVLVKYALLDLMAGRLKGVVIEGMEVDLKLPEGEASGPGPDLMWLQDTPAVIENLGGVRVHGATIAVERGGHPLVRVSDVELSVERDNHSGPGLQGALHSSELQLQKGDAELIITDASLAFEMDGGRFKAEGSMMTGGNEIPVSYQHQLEYLDDGWELDGSLEVEQAHLSSPWQNAAILIEEMEGKSVSGKVSAKMSFSLGKDRALQAALEASLSDGTLARVDEQPFIEGIDAEIMLDSMMHISTTEFHRVTARKATAFDVTMSDLALDYKLMKNGDVSLRNMSCKAMGGEVLIDDFVLPGGDADYAFIMRFKKLDLALLADLFPGFSGRISGTMDGLLPIEKRRGEINPAKGGMYLSPKTIGKLRYDAGDSFSAGLDPKTERYQQMKMVEQSLLDLDLKVLSVRLFDPRDGDKALVLRLEGHAPRVEGSPPIHLNLNGFKPDDETVDFFDLLLRHRDKLDFGL